MSATADRAVNRTPARAICKGYTPIVGLDHIRCCYPPAHTDRSPGGAHRPPVTGSLRSLEARLTVSFAWRRKEAERIPLA